MRLPRDLSGQELVKALGKYDYYKTRQTGSHIRLTTHLNSEHHITIPDHHPMKLGTLSAILSEIGIHLGKTKEEVLKDLFF